MNKMKGVSRLSTRHRGMTDNMHKEKFFGGAVPAVSVVVPVYNAKKYLGQAIGSILGQTFKDFEIILVDDCSTDGTYAYMHSLWGDNPRVCIVQNPRNLGPAAARNYGMRISRGKYIAFMDNDDCYHHDFLSNLYELAEAHQADVVSCMGFFHSESEEIPEDMSGRVLPDLDSNYTKEVIVAPETIKERMDGWLRNEYSRNCWNKLYSRDFLMLHDIRYRKASDDWGFVFACLLHARKYVKTPYIGYVYRNVQNSLSRSYDTSNMKRLEKEILGLDGMSGDFMDTMQESPFFQEHSEYCYMILAHQLAILERNCILRYFPQAGVVSGEVFMTASQSLKKIFGEHAPLAEFFFIQYQTQARRIAELEKQISKSE